MARTSLTVDTLTQRSVNGLDAVQPVSAADGGKIATDNTDKLLILLSAPAQVHEAQVITLSSFDGTDEFKMTDGVTETIAFVRGTNATAVVIQAELRTLTGDAGLTCAGITDAGPFTYTYSDYADHAMLAVSSPVGCTGVVTEGVKGVAGSIAVVIPRGDSPLAFAAQENIEVTLTQAARPTMVCIDSAGFINSDGTIHLDITDATDDLAGDILDVQLVRLP